MATEQIAACTLALPPEIWRMVLHSFRTTRKRKDLAELWTGCRGVSKHFKHEIEGLFIAHYLPRTILRFDITTSQFHNHNPRIEFHDHNILTIFNHISVDRATAFFQAKESDDATCLEKVHSEGGGSGPSHLVDLPRPSHDAVLPRVFFHADGMIEVDWRELFAALFAEDMYYHGTDVLSSIVTRWSTGGDWYKEGEMFELNMSRSTPAEVSRARVFRMAISRSWFTEVGEDPDMMCDVPWLGQGWLAAMPAITGD